MSETLEKDCGCCTDFYTALFQEARMVEYRMCGFVKSGEECVNYQKQVTTCTAGDRETTITIPTILLPIYPTIGWMPGQSCGGSSNTTGSTCTGPLIVNYSDVKNMSEIDDQARLDIGYMTWGGVAGGDAVGYPSSGVSYSISAYSGGHGGGASESRYIIRSGIKNKAVTIIFDLKRQDNLGVTTVETANAITMVLVANIWRDGTDPTYSFLGNLYTSDFVAVPLPDPPTCTYRQRWYSPKSIVFH